MFVTIICKIKELQMKEKHFVKSGFTTMNIESKTDGTKTCYRENVRYSSRRLFVLVLSFLLLCLPLSARAQLAPLLRSQDSLFGQTPEEVENAVEKVEKKPAIQKKTAEMKDKNTYREEKSIKVLDPENFYTHQKNRLFSGPQSGEKLPPFHVKGIDGKQFDITVPADGKPIVLFLQDSNGVGIKGLVNATNMLLNIDRIHKHRPTTDTEKSNQGLHIGVVILADDLEVLPEWAQHMFKNEIADVVSKGISQDGREGPGSYGLNRNVSQTVIVAKDGRVQHNFAFVQPMLYADSHLLGAVAQAIEVEAAKLEKWLNEDSQKTSNKQMKSNEDLYAQIQNAVKEGRLSKSDALEKLKILGFAVEEGDELLEKPKENAGTVEKKRPSINLEKMDAKEHKEREGKPEREGNPSRAELVKMFDKDGDGILNLEEGRTARRALANRVEQNRYRRSHVEVKEPADFKKTQENEVYSGPQPGENLLPLKVKGIKGEAKNIILDFNTMSTEQPLILFLQDETPSGLRGLVGICRLLTQISEKSNQKMHKIVVFLGDSPDTLTNQARKILPHIPLDVFIGISPDGREGPGNYGLNRNVAQTVIIAKDGKVLHNFAFTQPVLYPDPYVLGALAEAIGVKPTQLEKWLNEKPVDRQKMEK